MNFNYIPFLGSSSNFLVAVFAKLARRILLRPSSDSARKNKLGFASGKRGCLETQTCWFEAFDLAKCSSSTILAVLTNSNLELDIFNVSPPTLTLNLKFYIK